MSIQNKLFRNLLTSMANIEEYQSLKKHINKTFAKFSGNKLNPTKLDKFSSDLFSANNPNIIPGILNNNNGKDVFNEAKQILTDNFSNYMVNLRDFSFPYLMNDKKYTENIFTFFIPLYENSYYDNDNKKLDIKYNIGINVGLYLKQHANTHILTIKYQLAIFSITKENYSWHSYADINIVGLFEDNKHDKIYFSENNREKVFCKNNIKDVTKHNIFNKLIDDQLIKDPIGLSYGLSSSLQYCLGSIESLSGIRDSFDIKPVFGLDFYNMKLFNYLHKTMNQPVGDSI